MHVLNWSTAFRFVIEAAARRRRLPVATARRRLQRHRHRLLARFPLDKFNVSVGGELQPSTAVWATTAVYAAAGLCPHGFMDGADHSVYFLLNNPL